MHLILPEPEVCEEKERNYAKCIAPDQMLFFQPLVVVLNRNASPRPLLMNTHNKHCNFLWRNKKYNVLIQPLTWGYENAQQN